MPRVAEREVKPEKVKADPKKAAIWERRFVNPGPESSRPVELKEKGWTTRWVNTQLPGRFHQAVSVLGYEPVHKDELEHSLDLLGYEDRGDGTVRRGEKGIEVLMKIPTTVFKRIQQRKGELTLKNLKRTKEHMAQAAAKQFGDRAGDFVAGATGAAGEGIGGLKGSINDYVERVPLEEAEQ